MFHDVLDKRKLFQSKKVTTFQQAKTGNFAKGLTHDFCQKMQNFPFLFLGQNEVRNNVSLCSRYKRNYFTIEK